MTVVAKVGGTSMATAHSIRQVAGILLANQERKICVVSAPGKTTAGPKMTELLIHNHTLALLERVDDLSTKLGLEPKSKRALIDKLSILSQQSDEARVSFGEWCSAYLLAQVTGWRLIDACEVILFDTTHVRVQCTWKKDERVIVPGFYGWNVHEKAIQLFPRGGSDITASLIAARIGAILCENWTDVSGVFDTDPNQHVTASHYTHMSYQKLLKLAQEGAQVFHPEAIAPLQSAFIPLRIRNTFATEHEGTLVQ